MKNSEEQEQYGIYDHLYYTSSVFSHEDHGSLAYMQSFDSDSLCSMENHSDIRSDINTSGGVSQNTTFQFSLEFAPELESSFDATAIDCAWNPEGESQYSMMSSCGPLPLFQEFAEQPEETIATEGAGMCQALCSLDGLQQTVSLNGCSLSSHSLHPRPDVCTSEYQFESVSHKETPEISATFGKGMTNPENLQVRNLLGPYVTMSPPFLPSASTPIMQYDVNFLSHGTECSYDFLPGSRFPQTSCSLTDDSGGPVTQPQTCLIRSKKPCNCTKSQCLKLYCDCFANGRICSNCNCISCCNNTEHKAERYKAIKMYLNRNPEAFQPKITNRGLGEMKQHHNRGCNCKRSWCLKNYCECYEAKIMCSSICKCVGCRNYDHSVESKMGLAAEYDNILDTGFCKTGIYESNKCPPACVTLNDVETTCDSLITRAEEVEKEGYSLPQAEAMILQEFGQRLAQIVQSISTCRGLQA